MHCIAGEDDSQKNKHSHRQWGCDSLRLLLTDQINRMSYSGQLLVRKSPDFRNVGISFQGKMIPYSILVLSLSERAEPLSEEKKTRKNWSLKTQLLLYTQPVS